MKDATASSQSLGCADTRIMESSDRALLTFISAMLVFKDVLTLLCISYTSSTCIPIFNVRLMIPGLTSKQTNVRKYSE